MTKKAYAITDFLHLDNYLGTYIVSVAIEMGVFTALGKKPLAVNALARKMAVQAAPLELLLNVLVSYGFVNKKRALFNIGPQGKKFLVPHSPHYLGDIFLHRAKRWESWSELSSSIKKGQPVSVHQERRKHNAKAYRSFIMGMHNLALIDAKTVAQSLDLACYSTLIDIGGGSGAYTMSIAKKYPQLSCAILDVRETLAITKEIVSKERCRTRIKLVEGDYTVSLQGTYDVALLSKIIHQESVENNKKLIQRIYRALNPGGTLIIIDRFLNTSKTAPHDVALFGLYMYMHHRHIRSYSLADVKGWLKKAGFCAVKKMRVPLDQPSESVLIVRKPLRRKGG